MNRMVGGFVAAMLSMGGCAHVVDPASGPRVLVAGCWKASFSPDGRRIACGRFPGAGIDVVEVESGARRNLSALGKDPAWSPDGQLIALVTNANEKNIKTEEILVVPAGGGEPRRIATGGFPSFIKVAFGSRLLFQDRVSARVLGLDVATLDRAPDVVVSRMPGYYPAFTADGSQIAYGVDEAIMLKEPEGPARRGWHTIGSRGALVAFSPDGQYLAYGCFDDMPDGLWVVDVAERRGVQVLPGPFTMPAWSPDGRRLAFDRRANGVREVWVAGMDYVVDRLRREGKEMFNGGLVGGVVGK